MLDEWSPIWPRLKRCFKLPKFSLDTPELFSIPTIEVTENRARFGTWSPFTEFYIAIRLQIKAILLVTAGNTQKAAFRLLKCLEPAIGKIDARFQIIFIMSKHRIII